VLVESWCTSGRHGYYDQQTRIWGRSGTLLATSSQIVWFNVASGPTP
jgi:acyl-CoA thioesterase